MEAIRHLVMVYSYIISLIATSTVHVITSELNCHFYLANGSETHGNIRFAILLPKGKLPKNFTIQLARRFSTINNVTDFKAAAMTVSATHVSRKNFFVNLGSSYTHKKIF